MPPISSRFAAFPLFAAFFTALSSAHASGTLDEDFDAPSLDARSWSVADGWGNGSFTSTVWLKQQLAIGNGVATLVLDDAPCKAAASRCKGKSNAGAELRTTARWGNNSRVSARLKVARGEGVVTALFKYTGPYDGDPHDEVDIEILGKDPTKAQLNYWVDGKAKLEKTIPLGFDASQGFHDYGWQQTPSSITWYIDGRQVHRVEVNSPEQLPEAPGKVMLSIWAAQPGTGAERWAGDIRQTALPVAAQVDWVRIGGRR